MLFGYRLLFSGLPFSFTPTKYMLTLISINESRMTGWNLSAPVMKETTDATISVTYPYIATTVLFRYLRPIGMRKYVITVGNMSTNAKTKSGTALRPPSKRGAEKPVKQETRRATTAPEENV